MGGGASDRAEAGDAGRADGLSRTHWVAVEHSLVVARWFGVAFGIIQIAIYDAEPYPPGVEARAYALIGVLALGNLVATLLLRRADSGALARRLGVGTFALDVIVVCSFVWLYAFDDGSVFFLLFFVLPAEGALKFRMAGAMAAWAVCTAVYTARDFWSEAQFGYTVNMPSTGYRMGFLLIVALVFGTFARRLAERTGELENALRSLEAVSRWRSTLVDTLAHDLRSPIGNAVSALETMVARDPDQLDPEQLQEVTRSALRQSRQALDLTDDLLALARARQGSLTEDLEEIELGHVVDRIVEQLDDGSDSIDVEVDPDLRIRADARCLERILVNLVSNGLRHGRAPVRLSTSTGEGEILLHVTDHGDGVPDDLRETLFDTFAVGPRADSVGLGLWVVRQLAEGQGGRVAYAPRDGLPSFTVSFPAAPDALPVDGATIAGR